MLKNITTEKPTKEKIKIDAGRMAFDFIMAIMLCEITGLRGILPIMIFFSLSSAFAPKLEEKILGKKEGRTIVKKIVFWVVVALMLLISSVLQVIRENRELGF